MEGVSLGSAYLRLYGDRSSLDRELEKLKRYTDQLEKQGIKVKFDADTGQASRQVDGLRQRLHQLNQALNAVNGGMQGGGAGWGAMGQAMQDMASKAAASGGVIGKMGGALGGAAGMALKAIPVLGQLGMAVMGVQGIFQGVSAAINGVLGPLQNLAREAGRFNQQVAEASIFAAQSFAVIGPDGQAIQGTANQMRALRGTITKEYKEIQKEVAQISGATSSQIYEGFNLILQNAGALGKEGEDLANIRKLSTRLAAGMNTLGIPGDQLRSEVTSLMTGDVQMHDQLAKKLGYDRSTIEKLKSEGKFFPDLMQRLEKLYDGQKVLSESLENVRSNFQDVFETINTEGGMALERGLGKGLKNVLDPLTELQGSFANLMRSVSEALEPLLRILGEVAGWVVSLGSILASVNAIIGDVVAVILNFVEAVASPVLRGFGKILQVIAKAFEALSDVVSAVLRPISTFFRVLSGANEDDIDNAFDPILDGLEGISRWAEKAAVAIAKPFREFLKWRAYTQGRLKGKNKEQIKLDQANIDAQFDNAIGSSSAPSIRALGLASDTQKILQELQTRYSGSEEAQALAKQREISQLVQDRTKNEIEGLEQAIKLMQAQKGLQEALNGLAEARRGLVRQRSDFQVQVAGSPEARQQAEDRRNELAAQQEQQRIQERKALLGTEKQILQTQLEVQLRQQKIQQEQLNIQREEIRIQTLSLKRAKLDVFLKMRVAPAGSPEQKKLREQFILLGEEVGLRQNQLEIISRTIGLSKQSEQTARRAVSYQQQALDAQSQTLDVQGEGVQLSLQQQRVLSDINRKEQEIKNTLEDKQQRLSDEISDQEKLKEGLARELESEQRLEKVQKARLELKQAQLDVQTELAEQEMEVARAQQEARENPTSVRAVIGAEIKALATGQRGQRDLLSATRNLYDAKERQLRAEHQMQQIQLQIQQQREISELKIAAIQLKVLKLQAMQSMNQDLASRQLLRLQEQRDQISAGASGASGWNSTDPRGRSLIAMATRNGWNPADIAAIASYETGGTLNPSKPGRGAARGRIGLIQAGPNERSAYGLGTGNWDQEMLGIERYLKDRGAKPGMGLADLYATVNGGNAGAGYTADGNGIVARDPSTIRQLEIHRQQAVGRLGMSRAAVARLPGSITGRLDASGQNGADMPVDPNGEIRSYHNGIVREINKAGNNGNYVVIEYLDDLGNKLEATYSHIAAAVKIGQQIVGGQVIGRFDASGRTSGPHNSVDINSPGTNGALQRSSETAAARRGADLLVKGQVQGQLLRAPSLENAINANTQKLELNTDNLADIDNNINDIYNKKIPQQQQIAEYQNRALAVQQGGQLSTFNFQRREAELIDQVLNSPRGRFAAAITETLTQGISGAIRGAMQRLRSGEDFDFGEFFAEVMGDITDRLMQNILDAALAPIEKALNDTLFKGLSGFNPEEIQKQAADKMQQAGQTMLEAGQLMLQGSTEQAALPVGSSDLMSPQALQGLASYVEDSRAVIQQPSLPGSFAGSAFGDGLPIDFSSLQVAAQDGSEFANSLSQLNENLAKAPTAAQEANKGFQNVLGGMAGVAAGAMAIAGGISQIGKGGASNVLGGIGSILLGVGGALGGLNGMGLFGKRAGGGAVSARRPYLVGESGPELFLPGASGGVSTANQLRDAMGSGSGGRGGSPMLNMTFETTKIGGTEYVSREQLESAMAATRRQAARDGASRGMSMTLSKLQQSPATRSKVGLR